MTDFSKRVLSIAVPITIQNVISSGLNLVDNIMIGNLGPLPIAAVGLVNQFMFILMLVSFGCASGSGIFVAQYWGVKDVGNIEKTIEHILKVTYGLSIIFFIVLFFFPEQMLGFFSKDIEVIKAGIPYAKIVSFTTLMTSFSFIIAMALRTVEKARIPMYVSLVALGFNTIGNYLLIFGIGPFPELGVTGAAIATLLSRFVEFLIYVYLVSSRKYPIKLSLKGFFSFDRVFFKKLMKYASPVIINELLWSLGMTAYTLVFARMSTSAVVVRNISSTIENFGFVFFGGISSATVVLVGSELGRKKYDLAKQYAKRFLRLTAIAGAIAGLSIILFSRVIIDFYNVDEFIRGTVLTVIIIVGAAQPVKMLNGVNIVGVLRSGGETKFAMMLEIVSLWFIGVPLVAIAGLVLHWPIAAVYVCTIIEEVFKVTIGLKRYRSGKWIKNLISEKE